MCWTSTRRTYRQRVREHEGRIGYQQSRATEPGHGRVEASAPCQIRCHGLVPTYSACGGEQEQMGGVPKLRREGEPGGKRGVR